MLFSPKASGMEHHVPASRSRPTRGRGRRNDLVHRVVELYPQHFAPVAQLPQTPDGNLAGVLAEAPPLRCEELGFVGVQPQPRPVGDAGPASR